MRLAVLRPEPDGERTAAALRGMGHEVLVTPLLRMTPLSVGQLHGPWAAVLVTSANAIRAMSAHPALPELQRMRVLAVGDHTAEIARAAGFADVVSGDGNARDLAARAAKFCAKDKPLLYLVGQHRAFDFADSLERHGITVDTVVVYRMQAQTQLPANLADALRSGSLTGVLHYSARSAATYLSCAEGPTLRSAALSPRHFCLSEQVAAPFVAAGAAHVRVARQPDEASLFRLLDAD